MNKMNYTVKIIPHSFTYDWLLKKHYAHRIPSVTHAFGIYDSDNILQGVCTIGKPASPSLCDGVCGEEYSSMVYELNRLCLNDNHERNLASFFLARIFKQLEPMILVSYSDTAWNHVGYVYQATNFLYTGITKERTDIATPDGTHSRHYDKADEYPNRQFRSAKHRYILFIKCTSEIRAALNYPVMPYPKGDTLKYDAGYEPPQQGVLI